MGLELIPSALKAKFSFKERDHACAILARDFRAEFKDILDCLRAFRFKKSQVVVGGGGRSTVSMSIDRFFLKRGWREKQFDIKIEVEGQTVPIPTHKIDNFKNRVGVEVEWNNKDPFYDRDLNNFRLLRNLGVLSVGVIVTRMTELQAVFNEMGKGASYGNSTTHWEKLRPRVHGGGAGGCPLLLDGMGMNCYARTA